MFGTPLSVGRLLGVEIKLDWGLSILLVLLTINLGFGLLPLWHPDWGVALTWGVALSAALLFLASVLLHELSHAVVGRAYGVRISSITLFIFGGAANMEDEPPSPKAEFLMAAVGPLTSFILGALCTLLALPGLSHAATSSTGAGFGLSQLGPLSTLLLWLGPTNIILAVFNLLPGFPLDGGRMLRATLWRLLHDLVSATRWAAAVGSSFAWLLIGCGALMLGGVELPLLGGGFTQGAWLALIGWFLKNAASLSYRRVALREALAKVPVCDVMQAQVGAVSGDADLASVVRDHLSQREQPAVFVMRGADLLGVLTRRQVQEVPRADWPTTSAQSVMQPRERVPVVRPDESTTSALEQLDLARAEQAAVLAHGRVQGMLNRRDVLRLMERLKPPPPRDTSRAASP